ncbi:MAG: hypothetical protein Q9227_006766 [Pyrenula ochraceoflavens]
MKRMELISKTHKAADRFTPTAASERASQRSKQQGPRRLSSDDTKEPPFNPSFFAGNNMTSDYNLKSPCPKNEARSLIKTPPSPISLVPSEATDYPSRSSLNDATEPQESQSALQAQQKSHLEDRTTMVAKARESSVKSISTHSEANVTTLPEDLHLARLLNLCYTAKFEYLRTPEDELVSKKKKVKFLRDTAENTLQYIDEMRIEIDIETLQDIRKMRNEASSCAISLNHGRKRKFDNSKSGEISDAPIGPRANKRTERQHYSPHRSSTHHGLHQRTSRPSRCRTEFASPRPNRTVHLAGEEAEGLLRILVKVARSFETAEENLIETVKDRTVDAATGNHVKTVKENPIDAIKAHSIKTAKNKPLDLEEAKQINTTDQHKTNPKKDPYHVPSVPHIIEKI